MEAVGSDLLNFQTFKDKLEFSKISDLKILKTSVAKADKYSDYFAAVRVYFLDSREFYSSSLYEEITDYKVDEIQFFVEKLNNLRTEFEKAGITRFRDLKIKDVMNSPTELIPKMELNPVWIPKEFNHLNIKSYKDLLPHVSREDVHTIALMMCDEIDSKWYISKMKIMTKHVASFAEFEEF